MVAPPLMRHHIKRHSWPPLRNSRPLYFEESIDADPFAYFISPAEWNDADAGIQSKRRSRSLPPFQRRPLIPLSISATGKSPTARLRRWIERMEKQYFHRVRSELLPPQIILVEPSSPPIVPTTTPITIPRSPPVRGRRNVRSTSRQRVQPNSKTPPRRPRVWQEPSSAIWSVAEEDEDVGLGISV